MWFSGCVSECVCGLCCYLVLLRFPYNIFALCNKICNQKKMFSYLFGILVLFVSVRVHMFLCGRTLSNTQHTHRHRIHNKWIGSLIYYSYEPKVYPVACNRNTLPIWAKHTNDRTIWRRPDIGQHWNHRKRQHAALTTKFRTWKLLLWIRTFYRFLNGRNFPIQFNFNSFLHRMLWLRFFFFFRSFSFCFVLCAGARSFRVLNENCVNRGQQYYILARFLPLYR